MNSTSQFREAPDPLPDPRNLEGFEQFLADELPVSALSSGDSASNLRRLVSQGRRFCREVFANSPLGKVLLAPDGRVLKVNPVACSLLGISAETLMALGLHPALPPAACALLDRNLRDLLDGTKPRCLFEAEPRAEASRRHLQFHLSLMRDEAGQPFVIILGLQDVTAFRVAERALRRSEAELRALFDAMPAAVFATDAQGQVTYRNAHAESVWPLSAVRSADDFGRSLPLARAGGAPMPTGTNWVESALAGRRTVRETDLLLRPAGGEERQVIATSSPIVDPTGQLQGSINTLIDVTELKKLQQRQRLLEAQVSQASKMQAVGTLADGVAHEFNNLLTAIVVNLQMGQADLPQEHGAQSFLRAAIDSSRQARDLVNRLSAFSRKEATATAPTDLAEVVRESADLWRNTLPSGIDVRLMLEPRCPPVQGQARDLRDAVTQLAINAAGAMEKGGGTLAISLECGPPPQEMLERHPQVKPEHTVRLAVRDTGIGMSVSALDRLFEPFYTTRPLRSGGGLGLAGVYGIMKRQGGAIFVESELGRGTVFVLCFPPKAAIESS